MKDLGAIIEEHKNQLKSNAPFVFLMEIETKSDPVERLRICQFDKVVTFGEHSGDLSGTAIKYYPVPMSVGSVTQSGDGSLPQLQITVALSGPVNFLDIDANGGYADQPTKLRLISVLDPDQSIIDEDARIVSVEFGYEAIQFTVAGSDLFQSNFPHIVYSRTACNLQFGGHLCQYNLLASGAQYIGCGVTLAAGQVAEPFTLEACTAVGDDEVAIAGGLESARKHPKLWGGEKGIPRG